MKRLLTLTAALALAAGLAAVSPAQDYDQAPDSGKMPMSSGTEKVKTSKDKLIKQALSAAPRSISKDAAVMIPGEGGMLETVKTGTNGFTCFPDVDGQEIPDPVCADENATQWIMDLIAKKDKPTNTMPGIAYMAKGGWHWEKDGKIIMNKDEPGARRVKEPPHWMIFWAFDAPKTMLPTMPKKFGAYIMFEGTPYAHLMIYQDPNAIGK